MPCKRRMRATVKQCFTALARKGEGNISDRLKLSPHDVKTSSTSEFEFLKETN